MPGIGDEEKEEIIKRALKEALHEWLDDKFLMFGKWSMGAVMAAFFSAMVYFVLTQGRLK